MGEGGGAMRGEVKKIRRGGRVHTRDTSEGADASARTFTPAMQMMQAMQAKLVLSLRLRLRHLHSHLESCEARANASARCAYEKGNFPLSCVCVKLHSHCLISLASASNYIPTVLFLLRLRQISFTLSYFSCACVSACVAKM